MNQEKYKLEVNRENNVYVFESDGPRGVIMKVVQFCPVDLEESTFENVYNLGFGDYDSTTRTLDDKVNSNNGDRDIVLASVAAAALHFLSENSNLTLRAVGSTPDRTRLYQMGINRFYDEIITDYVMWGLTESKGWELFERNTNYQAFVMRKR
jgi:hypothetical protein